MNSLARLVDLVNRTQLPTLVQSSDASEPCILMPLHVYERLSKGDPESPQYEKMTTPADHVVVPPTPIQQEEVMTLHLEDLVGSHGLMQENTSESTASPQNMSMEDRFVFEGADRRILPDIRQKMPLSVSALDESGQTLA